MALSATAWAAGQLMSWCLPSGKQVRLSPHVFWLTLAKQHVHLAGLCSRNQTTGERLGGPCGCMMGRHVCVCSSASDHALLVGACARRPARPCCGVLLSHALAPHPL